jgi:hypothetical protein
MRKPALVTPAPLLPRLPPGVEPLLLSMHAERPASRKGRALLWSACWAGFAVYRLARRLGPSSRLGRVWAGAVEAWRELQSLTSPPAPAAARPGSNAGARAQTETALALCESLRRRTYDETARQSPELEGAVTYERFCREYWPRVSADLYASVTAATRRRLARHLSTPGLDGARLILEEN